MNNIPNFKNGWSLTKTTKVKPTGYKGYCLTIYGKDDITIIKEIKTKTANQLINNINKLIQQVEKESGWL